MRRIFVFLLLGGVACSDPLVIQPGFVQLSPPDTLVELSSRYEQLWDDVQKCSGAGGEFSRLTFYWHPTEDHPITLEDGQVAAAYTKWQTHRIWLGKTSGNNPFVVRHEMLHDLLQRGGHPPEYFEGKCDSLVSHGYLQH